MEGFVLPNEDHVLWGIIVVTYMFISGVGAGSLIIAALPSIQSMKEGVNFLRFRRFLTMVGAAAFTVVPLAVLADLLQPIRMWKVLLGNNLLSPMFYGSYILMALLACAYLQLWLIHHQAMIDLSKEKGILQPVYRLLSFGAEKWTEEIEQRNNRILSSLSKITAIISLVFIAYTGFLLGTIRSFSLWHTPLLTVIFILAAIASGFAVAAIIYSFAEKNKWNPHMSSLIAGSLALFLAAHVFVRLWDFLFFYYVENGLWAAADQLYFQEIPISYWGIEIVLGGILPVVLLSRKKWRMHRPILLTASILSLIGLYASRFNIVIGSQMVSRTGAGIIDPHIEIWGSEGIVAAIGLFLWLIFILMSYFAFFSKKTAES